MDTQLVTVSGKVQHVGFRDWAVRQARTLGVTGWVRNLGDGRVELLASGHGDAVAALVDACQSGPPLAQVNHVESRATNPPTSPQVKGFTKRFGG